MAVLMTGNLIDMPEGDSPSVVIASDYTLLACNDAYRRKVTADVEIGRSHCYETSHNYQTPCHENGEDCPLQQCQQTGLAQRVLHVHQTKNGAEFCDITMQPVYSNEGRLLGYQETLQTVTHASQNPQGKVMCGRSESFRDMLALINRVAPTDVSVLLQGESGTGKELAAKAIHDASDRSDMPFVVVECSGLTESLFESELFGYRKGAFTGATRDRSGLIEAADGGTLFLDEVGDIPLQLQVKLLRLLETGTYRPVGSVDVQRANFRLVSASHKLLPELINDGLFREDLYYRLAAFPIPLPPLRERLDDLPLLCDLFLQQQSERKQLTQEALKELSHYHFPGNIRELRNILQRAYLMADDQWITPQHLPALTPIVKSSPIESGKEIIPLKELEWRYLQEASKNYPGQASELASRLGISERTLYRKLSARPTL